MEPAGGVLFRSRSKEEEEEEEVEEEEEEVEEEDEVAVIGIVEEIVTMKTDTETPK